MQQLCKALLSTVEFGQREVQYNPTEITFDKSAQFAEIAIPGLDAPLQQFVRGQAEKLTLDLFFDTTDEGMGSEAVSVTTETDHFYKLIKIIPKTHAPPICTFFWNADFPGSSLGSADAPQGNQRRHGFKCIVESIKQKFTLFSPEGVPLRATLTVSLREYKTLNDQLTELDLQSPDHTHSHIVERGETLAAIANRYYQRPGQWRTIAEHEDNNLDDPRRLDPGAFLTIPPLV
jgi:nucleoid-associated protein YgaU